MFCGLGRVSNKESSPDVQTRFHLRSRHGIGAATDACRHFHQLFRQPAAAGHVDLYAANL